VYSTKIGKVAIVVFVYSIPWIFAPESLVVELAKPVIPNSVFITFHGRITIEFCGGATAILFDTDNIATCPTGP
jgi:hypothetical protein